MNIVFLALGSRGDIQPFIALALNLKKLNHTVLIASHDIYGELTRAYGIEFYSLSGNPIEIFASEEGQKLLKSKNAIKSAKIFSNMQLPLADKILSECLIACQHADGIIYNILGTNIAHSIAEKLNIKAIPAYSQPLHPTAAFPYVLKSSPENSGRILTLAGWYAMEALLWCFFRTKINQWRIKKLNLPPIQQTFFYWRTIRQKETLALYNISPSVLRKPNDWSEHIKITGYWYLSATSNWAPPQSIVDFIHADSPPLYIGFGSMGIADPSALIKLISQGLAQSKQRAILAGYFPKAALENLPSYIMHIEAIPHDWLFPQMLGVIHHCGAGTTAAALRAGKATIPIPFCLDQPYWAKKIAELGAATQPIPYKTLTSDNLTVAIKELVLNDSLSRCAKALQEKILAEDGVGKASDYITQYLNQGK
jgi:sterol 3beta-glucosyltransferase